LVRSILMRFALVTLIPVLALGWFLDVAVRHAIENRTAEVYSGMTEVLFHTAVENLMRPQDFSSPAPLSPQRAAILDNLNQRVGAKPGTVHVRMVTPSGRVIYTNRPTETGMQVTLTAPLKNALAGHTGTKFVRGRHTPSDRTRNLIEIYIPVRFTGDPHVYGAIVASGIEGSLLTTIDRDVRRIDLLLAIGLAALWLSLLPIAGSVSRRLQRHAAENKRLALHDALTSLPNRSLLHDRLSQAIAASARNGDLAGLLLVDLDRFKEVNDTLGHGKGDQLLVGVAQRLAHSVRECDTVARLGGDEFAVLLGGVDTVDEVAEVANRITQALTDPLLIDGIDVTARASIGAAVYPLDATNGEQLLQHADVAMYASKESGQPVTFYRAEFDSHSPTRLALAADLRRTLAGEEGELVLYYQPVACPADGRIAAMEALVRWEHPRRGLVQPIEFIPLAEQSGLIRPLTTQVLDLALAQVRRWLDEGLEMAVAVNLSARDLRDPTLLDDVRSTLDRHDVPAGLLELEVTETGVLANPEMAVELVSALRSLGVRIALDDFGTGYSSLTYLKRLNPDRLKIDRSFVNAMTHETTDAQIVRSLIELAHGLDIGVTAEGVETEEHWNLLTGLSCDLVQGYYLARPLPAPEATRWLTDRGAFVPVT
jgi:diguanylate cyclase (GGDEF)-like protein